MVGYNVHPFIFQKQLSKSNEVLPPHRIPTYQFCSHFMLPICSLHFDVTTSRYPDPGHINHVSYIVKSRLTIKHHGIFTGIWILWVTPQRTDWSWFSIFAISGQSHNVKKCHWKRNDYIYLIHVKPHHVSWLPSGKHTKKRWKIMSFNRSIHIPFGYLTLPWKIITFNRYIIYFYGSWIRYVK